MTYKVLDRINGPEDVKKLSADELTQLCSDLRACMIDTVSKNGGHLAASLGATELIVALHRSFDSPTDKIVFDVGHQAYAHKLLTGRRESFTGLRRSGGISGFPKREESCHDAFNTGHASTSISAALGMARGMKLEGKEGRVVAVIGDGAMTGGMAYEALDDAGASKTPLIIVLNDNSMSISPNVGAMHRSLDSMRISRGYYRFKQFIVRSLDTGKVGKWMSDHMQTLKNRIKHFLMPNLLFEELGFTYIGPIDGHDIARMTKLFTKAKELDHPVIVHVRTQKGKGYTFSENDPEKFHGIGAFSISTGEVNKRGAMGNSKVFGNALCELAKKDERIAAVTAAMPSGTGLTEFAKRFPDRFFDVGIAEQHALTMAAGMATTGARPVVAIYSSFLQRGYDQILHDICLMKLPVVICADRAGLVGEDGETHQGVYDAAFFLTMPNLAIYSPATTGELEAMLKMALEREEPCVIRYNRGVLPKLEVPTELSFGKWAVLNPISDVNIISTGTMAPLALEVAKKHGVGMIHARFLQPADSELLDELKQRHAKVLVVEENIPALCVVVTLKLNTCRVETLALPRTPITHASVTQQREKYGFTVEGIEAALSRLQGDEA